MTYSKLTPGSDATKSLDAVASGTGKVFAFNDCRQVSWGIRVNGTASSGGPVVIETNDIAPDYAGVWHELDSVDPVTLTGDDAYHSTYPGPVAWIRGRLATAVVGGAVVTVVFNGLEG